MLSVLLLSGILIAFPPLLQSESPVGVAPLRLLPGTAEIHPLEMSLCVLIVVCLPNPNCSRNTNEHVIRPPCDSGKCYIHFYRQGIYLSRLTLIASEELETTLIFAAF